MAYFCNSFRKREELIKYLSENNIGTMIHYPIPIHLQKAYEDLGCKQGDYPIAEKISNEQISLPMFYGLKDEEVDHIISCLNAWK